MNSKLNKYSFLINSKTNKKIYINNIYGSISIYNIENYLKRIESLKNTNNSYLEVIVIPNKLIYDLEHILWAIFIAKNRIEDEINISKDLFRETLLVLSCSDQLSKISKEYYIQEGKQEVFINIINLKKIL